MGICMTRAGWKPVFSDKHLWVSWSILYMSMYICVFAKSMHNQTSCFEQTYKTKTPCLSVCRPFSWNRTMAKDNPTLCHITVRQTTWWLARQKQVEPTVQKRCLFHHHLKPFVLWMREKYVYICIYIYTYTITMIMLIMMSSMFSLV